jgi:hypothetical protein
MWLDQLVAAKIAGFTAEILLFYVVVVTVIGNQHTCLIKIHEIRRQRGQQQQNIFIAVKICNNF